MQRNGSNCNEEVCKILRTEEIKKTLSSLLRFKGMETEGTIQSAQKQ